MVWFICDSCGDSIKKPKINAHLSQCAAESFTCIDCSVTFDRWSVRSHTSCISEKEKYVDVVTKPTGAKLLQSRNSRVAKPPSEIVGMEYLATSRPWRCSLCDIECTGRNELESHAKGAKHGRKVRKAKEIAGQSAAKANSDPPQGKVGEQNGNCDVTEMNGSSDGVPQVKERKVDENGDTTRKKAAKKKERRSDGGGGGGGDVAEEGNPKKKSKKNEDKPKKAPKEKQPREKKGGEDEVGSADDGSSGDGNSKKHSRRKNREKLQENGTQSGAQWAIQGEVERRKRRKTDEALLSKNGATERLELGGGGGGVGKTAEIDFQGAIAVASGALRKSGGTETVKKLKKKLRKKLGVEKINGIISKLEGHSNFRRDGSKIVLVDG